jgi:site-specific recombinase XerD
VTQLRQRMLEELQRRNYTPDTIRGYMHAVEEFANYFQKSPELMGADEVREFQLYMMREKKLALGTVALRMGALRFLYKKTLRRRDIDIEDLPLVRAPKKLPVVLSPEEVIRLIEGAANLWHRTILMLLYATGLRRTEAARLKVSDIDSALMLIHTCIKERDHGIVICRSRRSCSKPCASTGRLVNISRAFTYFPAAWNPSVPNVRSPTRSFGMLAMKQSSVPDSANESDRTR